jgi:hypothetical protein
MARPRKTASTGAVADDATPRGPSRVFARRDGGTPRGAVTHDSLVDDLAAFAQRGGVIEVLGNTPARRKATEGGTLAASDGDAARKRRR